MKTTMLLLLLTTLFFSHNIIADQIDELIQQMADQSKQIKDSSKGIINDLEDRIPKLKESRNEIYDNNFDDRCHKSLATAFYSAIESFEDVKYKMNGVYDDSSMVYSKATSLFPMAGMLDLGKNKYVIQDNLERLQRAGQKYNSTIDMYNKANNSLKKELELFELCTRNK